jgi:hypothetical protein
MMMMMMIIIIIMIIITLIKLLFNDILLYNTKANYKASIRHTNVNILKKETHK